MMTRTLKISTMVLPLILPAFLSACVSKSDYEAVQAQNQQLQAQNQQLQQQDTANRAQIDRLRGAIAYTINSDLLFASGSWNLSPAGEELISRVAEKLAPTQQIHLVVNGYTDNAPVGAALKRKGVTTNEELSQKRAEAVTQAMTAKGVNAQLLSAKGHGESDPVASNDTKQGRALNRRVEITYAPSGS